MNIVDFIGYVAAFFGTILMVPQLYKSLKTKQVKDISYVMLFIYLINCSLWEVYGLLIKSNPIIICNIIAFSLGLAQLLFKYKYEYSK